MAQKMPLRIRVRKTVVNETLETIQSNVVPPGQIWCIQHLAYENESGARGTFRRYLSSHGYNHYKAEHQGPGAAELIFTDKEQFMIPGERMVIQQASATAGDIIALYGDGYIVKSDFIPGGDDNA